MEMIPEITINAIIDRYAALLLDAYGVLVHSAGALPGAAAFIRRLNQIGKAYYLLTNDASKCRRPRPGVTKGMRWSSRRTVSSHPGVCSRAVSPCIT